MSAAPSPPFRKAAVDPTTLHQVMDVIRNINSVVPSDGAAAARRVNSRSPTRLPEILPCDPQRTARRPDPETIQQVLDMINEVELQGPSEGASSGSGMMITNKHKVEQKKIVARRPTRRWLPSIQENGVCLTGLRGQVDGAAKTGAPTYVADDGAKAGKDGDPESRDNNGARGKDSRWASLVLPPLLPTDGSVPMKVHKDAKGYRVGGRRYVRRDAANHSTTTHLPTANSTEADEAPVADTVNHRPHQKNPGGPVATTSVLPTNGCALIQAQRFSAHQGTSASSVMRVGLSEREHLGDGERVCHGDASKRSRAPDMVGGRHLRGGFLDPTLSPSGPPAFLAADFSSNHTGSTTKWANWTLAADGDEAPDLNGCSHEEAQDGEEAEEEPRTAVLPPQLPPPLHAAKDFSSSPLVQARKASAVYKVGGRRYRRAAKACWTDVRPALQATVVANGGDGGADGGGADDIPTRGQAIASHGGDDGLGTAHRDAAMTVPATLLAEDDYSLPPRDLTSTAGNWMDEEEEEEVQETYMAKATPCPSATCADGYIGDGQGSVSPPTLTSPLLPPISPPPNISPPPTISPLDGDMAAAPDDDTWGLKSALMLADSGFEEIATEDSCEEGEEEEEPNQMSQVPIPAFSTTYFATFTMAPNQDTHRPRVMTATIRRLDDMDMFMNR